MIIEHSGRKFTLKQKITARMENAIMRCVDTGNIQTSIFTDEFTDTLMRHMLEGNHEGIDWLDCESSIVHEVRDSFFQSANAAKSE
jgi:hypothetical protein